MAWNEPGKNNNDPWGNRNRNSDGPPDLDEMLKKTFRKLFGGGGGSGGSSGDGDNRSFVVIAAVVLVVVVGFYFFRGVGIVNEQERAVILRFGEYKETRGPGFRWNPPLLDKVFTVNVTRVRSWSTKEQMLTKDLNIVDITLSAQFSIESARDFVLNVKSPEGSLHQAANSALRHVVGSTQMHQVLTEGRGLVAVEVQQRLQTYLASYGAGIRVEKVNIEETNPPREVQTAFDDVIRAREDEERYKNEAQAYANDVIPGARGRAQEMVEQALGYRDEVVAKAEGEGERFSLLLTEYRKSPGVTRERLYLDAVQQVFSNSSKVMVDVEGGNNMLYLPLDKLVEAGNRAGASRGTPQSTREIDDLASRIADKVLQEAANASANRRREGR